MTDLDVDETHHPDRRSWVDSANRDDANFPIQNLPFGVFAVGEAAAKVGIAIGDQVLDVTAIASSLGDEAGAVARAAAGPTLVPLMEMSAAARNGLRRAVSAALDAKMGESPAIHGHLFRQDSVRMCLPARPGGFVDFFASIHHATNAGSIFRPAQPLLPNYKYVPIGYNGRVSTIRPSGDPVRRPNGQRMAPGATQPEFGPSRSLDFEMELGVFLAGRSNIGDPVPIGRSWDHVFGFCLLNDWSARDIQAWEYQPLGPFLGKSFATSISPWIVTAEAMRPFRVAALQRADGDPAPLPHLSDSEDQASGGVDVELEALLRTAAMAERGDAALRLGGASSRGLYWTVAQMISHQTSNGCNIEPADLYGTGTISGEGRESLGSLLEITRAGANRLKLPDGASRGFLEDGDELILRGRCRREGFVSIGFGDCSARILPAHP